jgi:hypothetical protein
MAVKRNVKINQAGIEEIFNNLITAAEKAGEEAITDLKNSATIPFDTGTLQLNTYWERNVNKTNQINLVSNTPYARRLYFHPEYNFRTTNNENAGGRWFDTYIDGDKKDFIEEKFKEFASEKWR